MSKISDFQRDLCSLVNRHSKESGSNTPDFILAQFLAECLAAFDCAMRQDEDKRSLYLTEGCTEAFDDAILRRSAWYGGV